MLAQGATPIAFHSRKAMASRGDTSGYSASSPTDGEYLPGPRALPACGFFDDDGNAGHRVQAGTHLPARPPLRHFAIGSDADLGEIDVEQRAQGLPVRRHRSSETPPATSRYVSPRVRVPARRSRRGARRGWISHFAASASSRKPARLSGKVSRCTEGSPSGRYMNQASSAVKLVIGASHFRIASQRMSTVVNAALRVDDDGGSQYRTSLRISK